MGDDSNRDGASRAPLTKERVLRAAIALADADGIQALSMRKLATALGVKAMSLYNHVENKDAIVSGIMDTVTREIDHPSAGTDWKLAVRRSAISARSVLLSHPWACSLWMSRKGDGPARLRHDEWVLRTLREAGFSKELTYHAFHILDSHVLGNAQQHISFPYEGEELAGMAAEFLEQLPHDEFPYFAEHVLQHLEPRSDDDGGFEFGLDLFLDGLEKLRGT